MASRLREPSSAIARAHSASDKRHWLLEKEHALLLRKIGKKKAALQLAKAARSEIQSQLQHEYSLLIAKKEQLLEQLHQALTRGLESSRNLSRKERAAMRRLYAPGLLASGESIPNKAHSKPTTKQSHKPHADEHASAQKATEQPDQLLKTIFRRLTVALHPDRESEEGKRAELTEVMKTLTRAYDSEDLAQLLELESRWLAPDPSRREPRAVQDQLKEYLTRNQYLRRQLRSLTAELKELRQVALNTDQSLVLLRQQVFELQQQLGFLAAYRAGNSCQQLLHPQ